MVRQNDVILEGVKPAEVERLRELAEGAVLSSPGQLMPLAAKGWIDVIEGIPLITLTGLTLLDRADHRVR